MYSTFSPLIFHHHFYFEFTSTFSISGYIIHNLGRTAILSFTTTLNQLGMLETEFLLKKNAIIFISGDASKSTITAIAVSVSISIVVISAAIFILVFRR